MNKPTYEDKMELAEFKHLQKQKEKDFFSRVGRFSIPRDTIDKEPLLALLIQSRVLIVRAESMYTRLTIDYEGYSDGFDLCDRGCYPPIYNVEIVKDDNDVAFNIEFTKTNSSY